MELRYSASEICSNPPSKELIEQLIEKQENWREAEFRLRMSAIIAVIIALTLVALLSSWTVLLVAMVVGFFVYMAAVLKAGFLASSWHDASLMIDDNEMFKHYIDIVEIDVSDLEALGTKNGSEPASQYIQRIKEERNTFYTLDIFIADYLAQL